MDAGSFLLWLWLRDVEKVPAGCRLRLLLILLTGLAQRADWSAVQVTRTNNALLPHAYPPHLWITWQSSGKRSGSRHGPPKTGRLEPAARNLHRGRSTQVWEIRITDEHDKLVSIARLTMAVVPRDAVMPPAIGDSAHFA